MGNQASDVKQYSDRDNCFSFEIYQLPNCGIKWQSSNFECCGTTWNLQRDPLEESNKTTAFYLQWAGTSNESLQVPIYYKMCIKSLYNTEILWKSYLICNTFNCTSRNGTVQRLDKPSATQGRASQCCFHVEFFPPEVAVSDETKKLICTKTDTKQKGACIEPIIPVLKKKFSPPQTSVVSNKLIQDLESLFVSKEGSDVTLKVKDKEFKVHTAILRARSSVFSAMFQEKMKENFSGVVIIDDSEANIFEVFLSYLYFGNIHSISNDNVAALHKIAHIYNVTDLVSHCIYYMVNNLSTSTFCDFFTVAIEHSESEMIKMCEAFFAKNIKDIIATAKWHIFIVEKPELGNECFKKAIL